MLAGRPDGELVVARPLGDRGVRFQRVLVDRGEGVLALDDDIRRGERLRDVAAGERVVVADVARLEVDLAQAVEETRRAG